MRKQLIFVILLWCGKVHRMTFHRWFSTNHNNNNTHNRKCACKCFHSNIDSISSFICALFLFHAIVITQSHLGDICYCARMTFIHPKFIASVINFIFTSLCVKLCVEWILHCTVQYYRTWIRLNKSYRFNRIYHHHLSSVFFNVVFNLFVFILRSRKRKLVHNVWISCVKKIDDDNHQMSIDGVFVLSSSCNHCARLWHHTGMYWNEEKYTVYITWLQTTKRISIEICIFWLRVMCCFT